MALQILPPRQQDFERCRQEVFSQDFLQTGIGSLGEKAQHAVLKNYYCPNPFCQEINFGGFVADIADERGITEIQTAGFGRLRKKLGCFLQAADVRVVYPVAAVKWVVWVDPQTGEVRARNRSPKKNAILGIFRELYSIRDLLWPDNFSLTLALLECEEYRLQNGWGRDGKRGSRREQMVPVSMLGEVVIEQPCQLLGLLPEGLPSPFTSADLRRLSHANTRLASYILLVLRQLELVELVGKQGNTHLYRLRPDDAAHEGGPHPLQFCRNAL